MKLTFNKALGDSDIKAFYNHNIDVFTDSPDFSWKLQDIKKEVKEGWELYSVKSGEEIIAAIFFKFSDGNLLTKNTAIKANYQGSGHSHEIKDFFDEKAKELNAKKILHYCSIDNFRMYSLNESHGYKKTKNLEGNLVEWVKDVK